MRTRRYFGVMSIIGHGLDLVECHRIARLLDAHTDRFSNRILTRAEQEKAASLADPVSFVAGRFAAKEAILKMIGTGWRDGIAWTDMEILPNAQGQPIVTLTGETARIAAGLGIQRILLSITHTKTHAAASAIGVGA